MPDHITDGWIILRTSGQSTLRLAQSLNDAGVVAWTPRMTVAMRCGKSRKRTDAPAPILPTFVFARSEYVAELHRLRTLPLSPHPGFSLFRDFEGSIPVIKDHHLASLRHAEERANRAAARRKRQAVPVGSRITLTEGPWAGLSGIVEASNGKAAVVNFGGAHSVEISAWLLPDDSVAAVASGKDVAARAA